MDSYAAINDGTGAGLCTRLAISRFRHVDIAQIVTGFILCSQQRVQLASR